MEKVIDYGYKISIILWFGIELWYFINSQGVMDKLVIKAFNSVSPYKAYDTGRTHAMGNGVYKLYVYYSNREAEHRSQVVYYRVIEDTVYIQVSKDVISYKVV